MKKLIIAIQIMIMAVLCSAEEITVSGTESKLIISEPVNVGFDQNKMISFKWKCNFSFPVRYAVFSFTRQSDGREFFVYYGSVNACTYFLPDKWYCVNIPMSELRAHPNIRLEDGDRLSSLNFWLENNPGHQATFSVEKDQLFETNCSQRRLDSEPEPIKIWPRTEPVPVFPPNQQQFMFLELPKMDFNGQIKIELNNIHATADLQGFAPALPPDELTIHPDEIKLVNDCSILTFPSRDYRNMPRIWVPLEVRTLSTDPITVKVMDNADNIITQRSFTTKQINIDPIQVDFPIAVWFFTGLDSRNVPRFTDNLMAAGVNSFYAMDGERVNGVLMENTVTDYAENAGAKTGTAFFTSKFLQFCKQDSLSEMLDNGEFKDNLKQYLIYLTGGKPVDVVVYDAETGAIKPGDKISGDCSKYGLEKFQRSLPDQPDITPEIIIANPEIRRAWINFNCQLSNAIAVQTRKAVSELWPDAAVKVYSGYEYDWGKQKDSTRERYAVDWQSMAAGRFEYAGAGYNATMDVLRHMNRVMAHRVEFMPAEAYIWGFDSTQSGSYNSDRMFIRLFEAFINSGLHGISIWQAHVMDPAALEAVNRFAHAAAALREFQDADVEYAPMEIEENVRPFAYILRKDDAKAVVYINNSNTTVNVDANIAVAPFSVYIDIL